MNIHVRSLDLWKSRVVNHGHWNKCLPLSLNGSCNCIFWLLSIYLCRSLIIYISKIFNHALYETIFSLADVLEWWGLWTRVWYVQGRLLTPSSVEAHEYAQETRTILKKIETLHNNDCSMCVNKQDSIWVFTNTHQ